MILRTRKVTKRFGSIPALAAATAEFLPGPVTALVGPSGAGKSTLFNVIGGLPAPDEGEVLLANGGGVETLNGLPPYLIARRGVGRLFQNIRVFRRLTALENVAVGARGLLGERASQYLFRNKLTRAREREVLESASYHLEFVGLADKATLWAEQLSYGEQKLVALARLLAADTQVLLLDELTTGVHPVRLEQLLEQIQMLAREHGRTIVIIEHYNDIISRVSDYVYRLERGRIAGSGTAREVLAAMAEASNASAT